MDLSDLKEVILPSIKNVDEQYKHILFTISDYAHSHDRAIFYRSAPCTDFDSPKWVISDISSPCLFPKNSSAGFVFHFCKVDQQNQANVLSVWVDTSRLSSHTFESDSINLNKNQILYRFGDVYYVQALNVNDINTAFLPTVKPCIRSKLERMNELLNEIEEYKSQYSVLLKEFLLHYNHIHKSVDMSNSLNALQVRLVEVQNQLLTEVAKKSGLTSLLSALTSKLDVLKCKKSDFLLETQFLDRRLQRISNRIRSRRSDIAKMMQLCNLRRFEMIRELTNCYPIEIVGRPSAFGSTTSTPSDYIMTICGLLLLESEAPGNSAAPAAYVDTGNGTLLPLPASTCSTFNINSNDTGNQDRQRLSQSLRGLLLSNRPSTATAAIFHVICLLQLLSTILNVPLKYSLDSVSSGGALRPGITDPLLPCSEGPLNEIFPLYAQRNTATYRHAIYLLNQNIVSLRTYFELQTSNPLATLWNIRNLFEARLLNVSPKSQRVVKGDNHSVGGK